MKTDCTRVRQSYDVLLCSEINVESNLMFEAWLLPNILTTLVTSLWSIFTNGGSIGGWYVLRIRSIDPGQFTIVGKCSMDVIYTVGHGFTISVVKRITRTFLDLSWLCRSYRGPLNVRDRKIVEPRMSPFARPSIWTAFENNSYVALGIARSRIGHEDRGKNVSNWFEVEQMFPLFNSEILNWNTVWFKSVAKLFERSIIYCVISLII